MRARVPVRDDAIDQGHLFERQLGDIDPGFAEPRLVIDPIVLSQQAPWLVRCRLLAVLREAQRRGRRHRSHADIGEPRFFELDANQEVRACRRVVARALIAHACRERSRVIAECGQHLEQQRVLFEAVATAPIVDELLHDLVGLELDRPAEQHVDVLEWDRLDVSADQAVQGLQRRCARADVAGAREVRV